MTIEELEFGLEREEDEDIEEADDFPSSPGVPKISTPEECDHLPEETSCLAFLKQIFGLADLARMSCKQCKSSTHVKHSFTGSALYLKWTCQKGHLVYRWCSQPVLNRLLHSRDFLSALAVVSSGNIYGKIALVTNMLNLKYLSESTFHRIQRTYLVPTVDRFWNRHQQDILESFQGQDLVVLGDGRMDSAGHSAQYCTYTVMENETKKILMLKTLDKRLTDQKSSNLEKKGFSFCLEELYEKNINISEVVTDAHLGISALMKSQYPNIKNSNDVWHVAKNLGKKILKSIWRGVLHHITNKHSWILAHGDGVNRCQHEPLSQEEINEKPWLDVNKDGAALSALTSVILDKRLLNRIHYLLNFRSTSEIEVFNQLVLMYCAKRYSYSPPVYRMRNLLAALDHNNNIERPVKKNKKGDIIYNRFFNKKSGRWSVHLIKGKKTYDHIKRLTKEALNMRLNDAIGMQGKRVLQQDDPRRISQNLAPIPPPPTKTLVEEHKSRFST